jgi:hypothetical protein
VQQFSINSAALNDLTVSGVVSIAPSCIGSSCRVDSVTIDRLGKREARRKKKNKNNMQQEEEKTKH